MDEQSSIKICSNSFNSFRAHASAKLPFDTAKSRFNKNSAMIRSFSEMLCSFSSSAPLAMPTFSIVTHRNVCLDVLLIAKHMQFVCIISFNCAKDFCMYIF